MPHIHKDIDLSVSAYIVHPDRDKVLLVHHKKLGLWLQVGGHVELDEDTDQALMREIQEECGLAVTILSRRVGPPPDKDVKILFRPDYVEIHRIDEGHRHLDLKYFALARTTELALAAGEHRDIRWFTREEVEDSQSQVHPHVAWYCLKALEEAQKAEIS